MASQCDVQTNFHNNFKPARLTTIQMLPEMSRTKGGQPVFDFKDGVIYEISLSNGLKCVVGQAGRCANTRTIEHERNIKKQGHPIVAGYSCDDIQQGHCSLPGLQGAKQEG